jgi:hypothetical protein
MNTMDKITVQIFCNKDTAMRLVIDHQLVRVLFQTLQVFFLLFVFTFSPFSLNFSNISTPSFSLSFINQ